MIMLVFPATSGSYQLITQMEWHCRGSPHQVITTVITIVITIVIAIVIMIAIMIVIMIVIVKIIMKSIKVSLFLITRSASTKC